MNTPGTPDAAGLLLATVGLDPERRSPCFDYGYFQLYDGVPLEAVAVGMLAVAEIIRSEARRRRLSCRRRTAPMNCRLANTSRPYVTSDAAH